jgi:hypothetical protein
MKTLRPALIFSRTRAERLPKYRAATVPIEVQLFANGGHSLNMGNHSKLVTVKVGLNRLADWLADNVRVTEPVANSK